MYLAHEYADRVAMLCQLQALNFLNSPVLIFVLRVLHVVLVKVIRYLRGVRIGLIFVRRDDVALAAPALIAALSPKVSMREALLGLHGLAGGRLHRITRLVVLRIRWGERAAASLCLRSPHSPVHLQGAVQARKLCTNLTAAHGIVSLCHPPHLRRHQIAKRALSNHTFHLGVGLNKFKKKLLQTDLAQELADSNSFLAVRIRD